MSNILLSLRLPKSMVEGLKTFSQEQHYMDMSEAVRSILREAFQSQTKHFDLELAKLKEDIKSSVDSTKKERLIREMRDLLNEMMKHD